MSNKENKEMLVQDEQSQQFNFMEYDDSENIIDDSDIYLSDDDDGSLEPKNKITSAQNRQVVKKRFRKTKIYDRDAFLERIALGVSTESALDLINLQSKNQLQKSLAMIIGTLNARRGFLYVTNDMNEFLELYEPIINSSVKMKNISTSNKQQLIGKHISFKIFFDK